ncbi:MAG: hypothetical protein IPH13_11865 [Planctomycetes bacterium]|nr:hypothetical protein [Planctomycetota bacterium]MCC7172727.1 hypothetical protein [Planctomycetota bacterium]
MNQRRSRRRKPLDVGMRDDEPSTIARVALLAISAAAVVNALAIWTFIRFDYDAGGVDSLLPLAGLAIALDLAAIFPVRDWWKAKRGSVRKPRS